MFLGYWDYVFPIIYIVGLHWDLHQVQVLRISMNKHFFFFSLVFGAMRGAVFVAYHSCLNFSCVVICWRRRGGQGLQLFKDDTEEYSDLEQFF